MLDLDCTSGNISDFPNCFFFIYVVIKGLFPKASVCLIRGTKVSLYSFYLEAALL